MPDSDQVSFKFLANIAQDEKTDRLDKEKAAILRDVFRPNRDGNLTLVDFVKSVDAVYRQVRILQSSVYNSAQVDRGYEKVINFIFFALVGALCLALVGIDPLSFILSLSSILVAFAFMIGAASAQYFEGVLLVLVRKPYDIGDRVAIVR